MLNPRYCIFHFIILFIFKAIFGHGFCKSAQKAFQIITANAFRVTAINFVGDFVLLLAKVGSERGTKNLIVFFI